MFCSFAKLNPKSTRLFASENFFISVLFLHLILGKVTKFLVEKLSSSEVISQNPDGGCGKHPPTLLIAFRVKSQRKQK